MLYGARKSVSGVAKKYVYPAETQTYFTEDGVHSFAVAYIRRIAHIVRFIGVTGNVHDGVTVFRKQFAELFAYSGRGSRNDYDFAIGYCHKSFSCR